MYNSVLIMLKNNRHPEGMNVNLSECHHLSARELKIILNLQINKHKTKKYELRMQNIRRFCS